MEVRPDPRVRIEGVEHQRLVELVVVGEHELEAVPLRDLAHVDLGVPLLDLLAGQHHRPRARRDQLPELLLRSGEHDPLLTAAKVVQGRQIRSVVPTLDARRLHLARLYLTYASALLPARNRAAERPSYRSCAMTGCVRLYSVSGSSRPSERHDACTRRPGSRPEHVRTSTGTEQPEA